MYNTIFISDIACDATKFCCSKKLLVAPASLEPTCVPCIFTHPRKIRSKVGGGSCEMRSAHLNSQLNKSINGKFLFFRLS